MTKLSWGATGERFYEAGIDHGVLYPRFVSGVAWNGLTSVSESPTGGEAVPYYQDGVKYLNIAAAEEFEASIDAISAPKEFALCDGTSSISNGLFVTQQPRRAFGLSYRTQHGNDLDVKYGYKLHLIYNALAAPSSRANSTSTDSASLITLSWKITTLPEAVAMRKRSAHLIIDSVLAGPTRMLNVENLLYGTTSTNPRLPLPNELATLFA